jgi:hypothetical protein
VSCVINKIKQKSFTNQSHRIVADWAHADYVEVPPEILLALGVITVIENA